MEQLKAYFGNMNEVAILGYGLEGRSTHRVLRLLFPDMKLVICDSNPNLQPIMLSGDTPHTTAWFLGDRWLEGLNEARMVMKSPGIPLHVLGRLPEHLSLSSQTEVFLNLFRNQIAGITGTKGKSTTASLLYHILGEAGRDVVLLGNIGKPAFDHIDNISPATRIVFEMSSHQLHHIGASPSMSILLNIFEEHLDYYKSFDPYRQAKINIARWQQPGDHLIYNADNHWVNQEVSQLDNAARRWRLGLPKGDEAGIYCQHDHLVLQDQGETLVFDGLCRNRLLRGNHNLINIGAATLAAHLLGISQDVIAKAVAGFSGLAHRLEYVGSFRGVQCYNDAIATIPEATVAALKALPATQSLILGGMDRGVSYSDLMDYVSQSPVENICFTGEAGRRMHAMASDIPAFSAKQLNWFSEFEKAAWHALHHTSRGKICLLSPAAPSYDAFSNFEEKGRCFRQIVSSASNSTP